MADRPNYAGHLRALGQALEILRVDRFEIEPDGKSYLVQVLTGRRQGHSEARRRTDESTVRYIWASAPDGAPAEEIDANLLYAMAKTLDLHYTPDDVVRLEQQWRAKRNNPNRTADPNSLAELLRTAGGYIANKGVYLTKIRREESALVIHYETKSGERREETLGDYDLRRASMRMLARRKQSGN